jgi:formate-dependent nitrite reductase cytochrome c552 subunit
MRKHGAILMGGVAATLFLGVLVIAGCGGGGPQTPQTVPVLAQFRQLLPAAQKAATRVGAAKCGTCHQADYTAWGQTKHSQALVDCESCHGPGSVHAAAPALTNILRGPDSVNAAVCGQCHSQENSDWSASKHAQIVADPVNAGSGNCFRCHSAEFRALNVDEPLAQGQTATQVDTAIGNLTSATLQSFTPATHATAACANCHDPHRNTTNLTSASEQFYLRRATANTDLTNVSPNVSAALYTTTNQICGACHNNRGGDPSDAGLTKNTSRPATHEGPEYNMLNGEGGAEDPNNPPPVRTSTHQLAPDQCVQCHMPNSRHTFTVSLDTSCSPCHTSADAAARESSVQTEIQNDLVALHTRMSNRAQQTFNDPNVWDYTTNIPSTSTVPKQSLIPIEVKRARHNYYFVLLDRSLGIHNAPYVRYLINYANTGLDNLGVSRVAPAPGMSRQEAFAILNRDIAKVRGSNARMTGL